VDRDNERRLARRVFGLETEYGFFCEALGVRIPSRDNVVRWVFERTVPGLRNGSVFLDNGGRLYLDSGLHPEYATPEADSASELVTHDKAGEHIIRDLVLRVRTLLREHRAAGSVLAFKNNTDTAGNSYGCHENYLVPRDVPFGHLAAALIPFLVTRQIFTGSGKVVQTPRGFIYCLS
jgi:proteasome accessory factor A